MKVLCSNCGTLRNSSSKNAARSRRSLCRSCSKKGNRNPFYGNSTHGKKMRSRVMNLSGGPTFWTTEGRERHLASQRSPEIRRKRRLIRIKQLNERHGQTGPNYNPKACRLIEEYGRKHGYNFQHAENGGEFYIKGLGYWVDGYDKEKNVVIEIDESHHKYQYEKDVLRQQEIEEHLHCKFIRIVL